MAWEARSGLKHELGSRREINYIRLNGLGSPFGFETVHLATLYRESPWLNGLGSPFGFETPQCHYSGTCRRKEGGRLIKKAKKEGGYYR